MGKIKIGLIILGSIALAGLVLAGIVMAKNGSNNGRDEYVQDEIIVKFKGDKEPFRVLKVPEGKVGEKIKEYKKRADVIYAEPNYIAYALWVPNDPYYKYQWHLDIPLSKEKPEWHGANGGGINIEPAWDISTGKGVTVAVIDTGIRKGTDLANTCFVPGYDFVNNDTDPTDDNGHGTHVAGTVAQSTNNGVGVAGVAYQSCLMPVKVLDATGAGYYADVASGIIYAADKGAKVINLSLGGSATSSAMEDALAYAYGKGVTIVAAAGNEGNTYNRPSYPAAYDAYVIAVGATRYDETRSYYSNYGSYLDIVAPGGDLNVDQNGDGYGDGVLQQTFTKTGVRITWGYYFFQGTSMAAPHVSGVAALVIANGNATTPDQIRTALQSKAEDKGIPGRDDIYGWGLVDVAAALGWSAVCVPTTEVCDGVDNDCGGLIDEGLTRSCGVTDVGTCTFGTETCLSGIWVGCDAVFPATETCNNIDDDCDGIVDQIAQQCGTTDVGACEYGAQTCSAGVWGDCVGNIEPTTEVCDGIDNDCDGLIDEDLGTTTCGIGACQVTVDNCVAGVPQTCTSGTPTTEICNGIDDDCNGEIDEGGVCEVVTTKCWSGTTNLYLYKATDQAQKFCKCVQGSYGYNSYKYNRSTKTVWKYIDPANNENWQVTSTSSKTPVYSVTCTDGKAYPTNLDYSYPK